MKQDKKLVKLLMNQKQELIAKKMMGTLNDFEQNVPNSISNETCEAFGVAVLASLPKQFPCFRETLQGLDATFLTSNPKISEFMVK